MAPPGQRHGPKRSPIWPACPCAGVRLGATVNTGTCQPRASERQCTRTRLLIAALVGEHRRHLTRRDGFHVGAPAHAWFTKQCSDQYGRGARMYVAQDERTRRRDGTDGFRHGLPGQCFGATGAAWAAAPVTDTPVRFGPGSAGLTVPVTAATTRRTDPASGPDATGAGAAAARPGGHQLQPDACSARRHAHLS